MSPSQRSLVALAQRLQSLTQPTTDHDYPIKFEDVGISPTKPKYICAECAWTTSAHAGALARHFTVMHTSRRKCPRCDYFCKSREDMERHRLQKHRHLCLGCQRFFPTINEHRDHEPCGSQLRIDPSLVNGASSHTTVDSPAGEKIPGSGQSILNKRGSVQSGSCPDPGCQSTFLDFNTLYEHYVGLHPLCIVYLGHPKPFKCPFCSKRYQHERFIPGHVRTHKPKALDWPGTGDAENQEALFRRSRVAVAEREPALHAEPQPPADRTSGDEEEEYPTNIKVEEEHSTVKEEEDCPLVFRDSMIYIDDRFEPISPLLEPLGRISENEPQRFNEMTPIGLELQASRADSPSFHPVKETPAAEIAVQSPSIKPELSDSMDLDEDYPEIFALDDDELSSRNSTLDSNIIVAQLLDESFHQVFSREIVRALRMEHFINISEVVDLFNYFLDQHQRIFVLEQIASIDLNQHDSNILEALHSTVFKTLIDAWVDFKRLAIRLAPQLIVQANNQRIGSGKSVTWALLQYCLNLENVIYRNKVNIAHHFLRDQPLDDFAVTPNAPFPRLVAALAERVKNRTVHDISLVFTNEMILKEMLDYVRILQMIFRPLYPLAAGNEPLWRELRLI